MTPTTDDMLGRLFALIHDSGPCTREEYELDAAIRRTLEKVKEWQEVARDIMPRDIGPLLQGPQVDRFLIGIRDFDPGKED